MRESPSPSQNADRTLRETVTLLGLAIAAVLPALFWRQLPARVPIHFDLHGVSNGFGSRGSLFLLPAIAFFIYLFLRIIARFPRSFNLPVPPGSPARPCYERITISLLGWLRLELVWIIAAIQAMLLRTALGHSHRLWALVVPLQIAIVIFTLLFFLARARRACGGRP